MIEYMLARIIEGEFEKVVGKQQHETRKAMHVGFHMSTGNTTDQYRIIHMYLFGPCNYVHVATQEERIDEEGKRHVEPMKHVCYHDSCWRDAVQRVIWNNRDDMNGFQSLLKLFDWYDVLTLSEDEVKYLGLLDQSKRVSGFGSDKEKERLAEATKVNPFDQRTVWKNA